MRTDTSRKVRFFSKKLLLVNILLIILSFIYTLSLCEQCQISRELLFTSFVAAWISLIINLASYTVSSIEDFIENMKSRAILWSKAMDWVRKFEMLPPEVQASYVRKCTLTLQLTALAILLLMGFLAPTAVAYKLSPLIVVIMLIVLAMSLCVYIYVTFLKLIKQIGH